MNEGSNKIMLIDWIKAEEKPDKKQTVKGRILLDLKTKTDNLEKEVGEKTKNLFQMEEDLQSKIEELKQTKVNNKAIIDEKEGIFRDLRLEIKNLKIDLEKKNSKINELSDLLKEEESKLLEVSTSSEQKISSMDSELQSAYDNISDLENNLNSIDSKIVSKDEEISKKVAVIKKLEEEKNTLNLELSEKMKSLLQTESKIYELEKELDEKNEKAEIQSKRLEEVEKELEELKSPELGTLAYSYETRITCPMCQQVGKNVKTVEDKDTVLSYIGNIPMYAKKYVCKKCCYEWK